LAIYTYSMSAEVKTPYIIAEIGQAHDGSLGTLYAYIDAVAACGVDAVKFQMHIAEAESSSFEPFRVAFSRQDETRFDYWQRTSFSFAQWKDIKSYCDGKNIDFVCSPFSNLAVQWLRDLKPSYYKIGSGEVGNLLMLENIALEQTPVILSSGMSTFQELDTAVGLFKERGVPISVLQCTTAYPTMPEQYGFNLLGELKQRYGIPVGFSDHSGRPETCIAATALGAEILEFHVVFHRGMFGPDVPASLTIEETRELVSAIRNVSAALHHPIDKDDITAFSQLRTIFGKSLAVNQDLPSGHVLALSDLETKKPGDRGIPAANFREVIGRKTSRSLSKWDFLNFDDLV